MSPSRRDSLPPFEISKARLNISQVVAIIGVVGGGAIAWASQRSETTALRADFDKMAVRQERIEAALLEVPAIKNDIAWIKEYLRTGRDSH